MTASKKWALLRAVVLSKSRKKIIQNGSTSSEEERIFQALRMEKELYKKKLEQVKHTTELAKILESIAKQEKRRNQISNDMRTTEQPIVREIKRAHSAGERDEKEVRKTCGVARKQLRQKRAELNRVVAKKKATIQKLHTKLNVIMKEEDNEESMRNSGLPTLQLNADRKFIHDKLPPIQVPKNKTKEKTRLPPINNKSTVKNQPKEKIRPTLKPGRSSYPVVRDLLNRMEVSLDKLDKYTSARLTSKAEKMKEELREIENSLMTELKTIKSKQKVEARVQKMRVKYKDIVRKIHVKEKKTGAREEQKQTKMDEISLERERMRKLRYDQLQLKLRRMKIEQEMFGYLANSRFTQRGFSYF